MSQAEDSVQAGTAGRTFVENAVYTVGEAAAILRLSTRTVRELFRSGAIAAQTQHGEFRTTGWALRAYAEGTIRICQEKFPGKD